MDLIGELRQRQPRERNGAYKAWIARLPCIACMATSRGINTQVHVAHLRIASAEHGKRETGKSEKPSDKPWTTPLCPWHHQRDYGPQSQEAQGERKFWPALGIDVFILCKDLEAAYDAGANGFGVIARHAGLARKNREERQ